MKNKYKNCEVGTNQELVSLPLEQYDFFKSLEARVCAAVEYVSRSDYPDAKLILAIIGTDYALEVLDKISEKNNGQEDAT